jgi:hypothetical protein
MFEYVQIKMILKRQFQIVLINVFKRSKLAPRKPPSNGPTTRPWYDEKQFLIERARQAPRDARQRIPLARTRGRQIRQATWPPDLPAPR